MRYLIPALSICLLSAGCNNKAISPFRHSNLESNFINIDPDSSYTLRTGKGSVITIAAGTFDADEGKAVNIEIKEALSMQDILLAGLTTSSNGRPLRSGGMIYFNATREGEQLEPKKPIAISLPSEIYDPAMQLFKGEPGEDSSINWVDPQPLDTTPHAQQILLGEQLFKNNCASCHKPLKDFTGPALAGARLRAPNKQWIYDFIASPAKMISRKDSYTVQLWQDWKPLVMTGFPALTKYEVDAILAYSENQSRLYPDSVNYPGYPQEGSSGDTSNTATADGADPCGTDTLFYPSEVSDMLASTTAFAMPDSLTPAADMDYLREGFIDPIVTERMYDFTISSNGWYNVDAFVEGMEGTRAVTIVASTHNPYEAKMQLYLFCPDKKLLSVGVAKKTNEFRFDKLNGNIPLFLNDDAILLAFGSNNSQLYYGIKKFRIQQSQDLAIPLSPISEDELKAMIKKNSIEGIELDSYQKEFEVVARPCDPMPSANK
ncbi:MAG: cytochrome c [Chitinophagaceae bacterium]|nr:MAG: cytochrome c [Chitinophagaceae bacterium]